MNASQKHYAQLASMYRAAPCNAPLAPRVTVGDGRAQIVVQVRDDFISSGGAVDSGIYQKLLTDAALYAANSQDVEVMLVTASFNSQLMLPVYGGTLKAVGKLARAGNNMLFADAALTNDAGEQLGRGSGVFVRSGTYLSTLTTYSAIPPPPGTKVYPRRNLQPRRSSAI